MQVLPLHDLDLLSVTLSYMQQICLSLFLVFEPTKMIEQQQQCAIIANFGKEEEKVKLANNPDLFSFPFS